MSLESSVTVNVMLAFKDDTDVYYGDVMEELQSSNTV